MGDLCECLTDFLRISEFSTIWLIVCVYRSDVLKRWCVSPSEPPCLAELERIQVQEGGKNKLGIYYVLHVPA